MEYELLMSLGKNVLWLLLLGWTFFRFYRFSPAKYPRPENCTKKDYRSWRELEANALQIAGVGAACSILATAFLRPSNVDAAMKLGMFRTGFWLLGLISILLIQSAAKDKAKRLGIL